MKQLLLWVWFVVWLTGHGWLAALTAATAVSRRPWQSLSLSLLRKASPSRTPGVCFASAEVLHTHTKTLHAACVFYTTLCQKTPLNAPLFIGGKRTVSACSVPALSALASK